jgi:hypothetical protein
VLVAFCAFVWIGVRRAGYVEFDTARRLALTGTFRHILNARLLVKSFERKATEAVDVEEYWEVIRDAGRQFGCAHVRMALPGAVYEDRDETQDLQRCCTIRIPLADEGYVNFRYPVEASLQNAMAIGSMAEILQRELAARPMEKAVPPRRKLSMAAVTPQAWQGRKPRTVSVSKSITPAGG